MKPKTKITFSAHFNLLKIFFCSWLFRSEFPLRNWTLCVSPFQVRNPPRNVDRNATLLSSCDPEHLPLGDWHPHLLFLIRSAFRAECFYVDVNRKILETLGNKIYTSGDIRFWGAVLLSNMVTLIILWFCGESGTFGTIQSSNWTSLPVTYKNVSCSLDTTIFTCNFSFRINEGISFIVNWKISPKWI